MGSLNVVSRTGWAEVSLTHGAGNRRGLHFYPIGTSKSCYSHPPWTTGHAPGQTRNMEAVQDTLDPQKSIIWFNCLRKTHTLFQGSGFSPPKIFPSLFIIFKIWPVTLAPDIIVGRSPKSALDQAPSWLTQQEGASTPGRRLSWSWICYMFTPICSLVFSQCPSHPSCHLRVNFSSCLTLCPM